MIVIRPDGKPESARITTLLEDRGGTLWCGTEAGLYADRRHGQPDAAARRSTNWAAGGGLGAIRKSVAWRKMRRVRCGSEPPMEP